MNPLFTVIVDKVIEVSVRIGGPALIPSIPAFGSAVNLHPVSVDDLKSKTMHKYIIDAVAVGSKDIWNVGNDINIFKAAVDTAVLRC